MSQALTTLIEDEALRIRLGQHARKRILELHQADRLRGLSEKYRKLGTGGKSEGGEPLTV